MGPLLGNCLAACMADLTPDLQVSRGWSGGAKVLGKLPVPGPPTYLDYSRTRAYCPCVRCGWGLFGHFSLIYHFSFLSPSLLETARYRLKYCLKGPLNPKQPTKKSRCHCHEAQSFHSLQSPSLSCFQVILGLLGPCFPIICMSKAILTALLEHSTCPYQQSLLSIRMRSRSSIPSHASSSVDLMLAVSCGLTLQICLIIALSFSCRCWRLGFVNGQVQVSYTGNHYFDRCCS